MLLEEFDYPAAFARMDSVLHKLAILEGTSGVGAVVAPALRTVSDGLSADLRESKTAWPVAGPRGTRIR